MLNLTADLQGRTDVKVLDLQGRTVKHYVVNGLSALRLNVSDLQSGVYFLSVSHEGSTMVNKFVVE